MSSHSLFQRIFPTQQSNPNLLHFRQTLYPLRHQGSLLIAHKIGHIWGEIKCGSVKESTLGGRDVACQLWQSASGKPALPSEHLSPPAPRPVAATLHLVQPGRPGIIPVDRGIINTQYVGSWWSVRWLLQVMLTCSISAHASSQAVWLTFLACPLLLFTGSLWPLSLLHLPAVSKFSSLLRAFSHSPQAKPPGSKPLFQAADPCSLLPVGGLPLVWVSFVNWRIIALQYCVSFCCTTVWIS